jgi:hypothetical protein
MKAAGDDSPESNRLNDIELPSFLNPTPYKENNKFIGLTYTNLISPRSKITLSNTLMQQIY